MSNTPTNDEREALAFTLFLIESGQDEDWLRGVWANHPAEHPVKVGYYRQADAILAAGFRRSEVPEPSALPDYFAPKPMPQVTFAERLSARSDYELGRMAGRDEIRAEQEERKKSGVWVEHAGHRNVAPKGEPSDAQVMAASVVLDGQIAFDLLRAALRAAGGAR